MVFGDGIAGTKTRDNIHEQAAKTQASRLVTICENHEFNVPGLVNNVSLRTVVDHTAACSCGASAFGRLARAQRALIRNTSDVILTFRFGTSTADKFTLVAGEYLDWDFHEFTDLFITNPSALAQAVKITLG